MTAAFTIENNTQRWLGDQRVSVRNTLRVREHDGRVRARTTLLWDDSPRELFDGDEVELAGGRYSVAINANPPGHVTFTPADAT